MHTELLEQATLACDQLKPTELHGAVCGMAVGRPGTFVLTELIELMGTDAFTDESSVQTFAQTALDLLYAQDMEFQLLLVDEDAPLSERLTAMGEWCASFLAGFGAVYTEPERALPDEVGEILRDFAAISALDDEVEEGTDDGDVQENESAFMEINEYIRVGVVLTLTLMQEVLDQQDSGAPDGEQFE